MNLKVKRAIILAGVALFLSLAVFLYFQDPIDGDLFPCWFKSRFGVTCPGCGLTRALYSLLHLDLLRAVRYHAWYVLCLPVAGYALLSLGLNHFFDRKILPTIPFRLWEVWVFVGGLMVYQVLRWIFPALSLA